MQTYKTALRILWAHKIYMIIYIISFGALMLSFGISGIITAGNTMTSLSTHLSASSRDMTANLPKAKIAVINRDSGNVAPGLRKYLARSATIVSLPDTQERLQDAVARNDVDLVVIIPHGFSQRFSAAAKTSLIDHDTSNDASTPLVNTTMSYLSHEGALAKIDVDGYFSQLRNIVASGTRNTLSSAVSYTVQQSQREGLSPNIQVLSNTKNHGKSLVDNFGLTMKLSIYPVFMAMTVCIALLIGVFNAQETNNRMFSSAVRPQMVGMQELLACVSLGLICWLLYCSIAIMAIAPFNHHFSAIGLIPLIMTVSSQFICTLISVGFGYMLGQCRVSSIVANAIATSFGLVLMFTSGAAFDSSVMPDSMITLGKLLPGWWFTVSIDNALGISSSQTSHPSVMGWLQSTGLVALFGIAFVCIGLAVGKYRSYHAQSSMAPSMTILSELG